MLELFLGQIPEAVFFALFMIYAKGLKEKRVLFTTLMVLEYLLLKYTFKYSWIFHIGLMIMTFLTLKILYKEKSQITDMFILLIAYVFLAIVSLVSYFIVLFTIKNFMVANILNKILLFIPLLILRYKLYKIQDIYKKIWNRNDKVDKKIKSTTFRAINIFIFNLLFYIINICMLYTLIIGRGV